MDTNRTTIAYGLNLPLAGDAYDHTDRIATTLATVKDRCPDVKLIEAGNDTTAETIFLVTFEETVQPGTYVRAGASPEQQGEWNTQLAFAIDALGYSGLPGMEAPAWLCMSDPE